MILAIYSHKYGADHYLLRDDQEVERLRKEIAEEYWDLDDPWTGSPEQVDHYWQDKSESALEWFDSVSLTYHYEKP
jgi:protein-tyrosine-phosphatase